jgi:uncharacterized protein YcbX
VLVGGLWLHPVKSLQGHPVATSLVGPAGVIGDRAFGIRDVTTGALLSAKKEPRLLRATARMEGEGVVVTVPGAGSAGGDAASPLLSQWLGRPVAVEMTSAMPYVDEAHLHLVGRGELGEWDPRRVRANVVVDGARDLDDLVGWRLRLGDVVVDVYKRTKRCGMPTMQQPGITKDTTVLRTLARDRDLRLGVYARVVTPGRLAVGAPITVA